MARKHHFDFQAVIAQALRELGAKQIEHQGYDWQLNTRAGLLRLRPLKTGIDCRFEDRELAHQVVHHGYLDRHAGEWNWYFDDHPHADDVESFLRQLTGLMDDLNLMEKMVVRLNARLRASGQTVTVLEPSDGDEFTVTFPPNRLPPAAPRRAAKKRNLRAAYLGADYVFEAEGQPYTLRVGEKNPHVRDLLAKHGVQGAAFVTACNPASLLLGDVHNKLAMRALKRDLRGSDRPKAMYEGAGHGLAGIWPSEPSLMLLGVDRLQAEKLGRRYGQYAIVWVDETGTPALVELADLDRASRHPLRNPPFKWVQLGFEWGYEWADIRVSPSQWRRILAGEELSLETRAWNEGEKFTMYWDFDQGERLYVSYGDDGGTTYDGKIAGVSMTLT